MHRRTFLKVAGAAGLAARTGRLYARARAAADLMFHGGRIVTMNPDQPTAKAVAVKGGRIQAVGSAADIERLCDGQTQRVDLAGQCLSPGLIDAHSHLMSFGQTELDFVSLRPPRVHSFASLRAVLADAARKTPKGEWLVGRGFNEFDEDRFPRRWEIDEATPDHPALLIHWTGQYGIANTAALRKANLLRTDVRDPYGGKYGRDRLTGLPDGTLLHYSAIYSVHLPEMQPDRRREAAAWGADRFAREGVTCVHDNFCSAQHAARYVEAERAGTLPVRMRVYPYVPNQELCRQLLKVNRYRGPLVRLQGLKLAVDGYPLMYDVLPQHAHLNLPMHPGDEFAAIVGLIHGADLQVDVHAAGDRGVDLTLDAFAKAAGSDRAVRERRHRIEHFMFRRDASLRRAADMGVPVCTQPLHMVVRGADFEQKLGRAVAQAMVPLASFRRAGVKVSFGADVPASPSHRPLDSIRSAMVRRTAKNQPLDPAERISFMAGIEAHTIDAAWAAFDEAEMGSIAAGKFADLAVWNHDLTTVRTVADVDQLKVTATYLAGKPTFPAAE